MIFNKNSCCLLGLLVWLLPCMHGQVLRTPEQIDPIPADDPPIFCTPGVSNKSKSKGLVLEYGLHGGFNTTTSSLLSGSTTTTRINRVEDFKLTAKLPLVNKPTLKVLGGYEYTSEIIQFGDIAGEYAGIISSIDNSPLRSNKFSMYMSKALNEKYYAIFRVRAAFSGDYSTWANFSNRYATYSGAGILGVKPNSDTEWGVGLTYSHGFDRKRLLPFFFYNRTFNDKWGVESVLPVQIYGRYNVNRDLIVLFGGQYQSKAYSIDVFEHSNALPIESEFRHSEVKFQVSVEKKLYSWVWFNAKAGYEIPFRAQFINLEAPELSFRYRSGSRPFIKVGLFLSPPDKKYIR